MVYTRIEYVCDTCNRGYPDELSARVCEHAHVVQEFSADLRSDLQKIMKEPPHGR